MSSRVASGQLGVTAIVVARVRVLLVRSDAFSQLALSLLTSTPPGGRMAYENLRLERIAKSIYRD